MDDWHAARYATEEGFLDDSVALHRITQLQSALPYVMQARGAVLWRWDTARPLWKRREEFRSLSREVSQTYAGSWWNVIERKYPALNLLAWAGASWLGTLEKRLNEGLDTAKRFLVQATAFKPFSPDAGGKGRISSYRIIRHREGTLLRVTEESRLIAALVDAVNAEAAFGVTLIVPRNSDRNVIGEMRTRFVTVTGSVLDEVGKLIPEDQRNGLLLEVLAA